LFIFSINSFSTLLSFNGAQLEQLNKSCLEKKKSLDCYTYALDLEKKGKKKEMLTYFDRACSYGDDNVECTRFGIELGEAGYIDESLKVLEKYCKRNHADACMYGGLVSRSLYFLEKDSHKKKIAFHDAKTFLKKACALGDNWSCAPKIRW
jgi:hypothetical protein